jgi:hypothetical protein
VKAVGARAQGDGRFVRSWVVLHRYLDPRPLLT